MAKPDLGEKQLCPSCGSKFYDLGKRPAVCPKCQTAFDPSDETVKLKRVKTRTPAYEADYEDDEEAPKRRPAAEGEDGFEEEPDDAPELDPEAADEPVLTGDEDEEEAPSPDALPAGFSETDEDSEVVADDEDDGVPLLEDDEEFSDDDLGDVAEGDDEER